VADDSGNEEVDVTIAAGASVVVAKGVNAGPSIANGVNSGSVNVTHGFGGTPTAVTIGWKDGYPTGVRNGGGTEYLGWYISAVGATTFTVTLFLHSAGVTNGATANFPFFWIAV
jgi:hypothetical protein